MLEMDPKKIRLFDPKLGLFFLICCALFLCSPVQGWAKGDGIKIGKRGRFHPRLFVNFGFDSNVFHRSYQTSAGSQFSEIIGAPFLSVRPGLELNFETKSIAFLLSGYANYTHFFSLTSQRTDALNTVTAKADLEAQFMRDGPVTISLINNFSRNTGDSFTASDIFAQASFYVRPGTQNGAVFITHSNQTSLVLSFKPGGGALTFDVGYTFGLNFYPSSDMDHNNHTFAVGLKWSFFPRTAFTFDGTFNIQNFNPRLDFSQSSSVNNSMMPFKAYVGIIGQFTDRLLLTFRVGGGYSLVTGTSVAALSDNYGMVVGNVDLTYKISLTTFFRVGFRHDFGPSVFSNYYHETVGYAEFGSQFGNPLRPFVLNLRADGGFVGFGEISSTLGNGQFNATTTNANGNFVRGDTMVRGSVKFDWHVFPFWEIGILGRVEFRNSNLFVVIGNDQVGLGFFKFDVMLNTELAF